jgi:hypothetical protein
MNLLSKKVLIGLLALICGLQELSAREKDYDYFNILLYGGKVNVKSKNFIRDYPSYNQFFASQLKVPFAAPTPQFGYGLGFRANVENLAFIDLSFERNGSQASAELVDGSKYSLNFRQNGLMAMIGFKIAGSKPIYGGITIGAWMMTQQRETEFTPGTPNSYNQLGFFPGTLTAEKVFETAGACGFYLGTNFARSPVNLFGRYVLSMEGILTDSYDYNLIGLQAGLTIRLGPHYE